MLLPSPGRRGAEPVLRAMPSPQKCPGGHGADAERRPPRWQQSPGEEAASWPPAQTSAELGRKSRMCFERRGLGGQKDIPAANGGVSSAQPIFEVFLLSLEK